MPKRSLRALLAVAMLAGCDQPERQPARTIRLPPVRLPVGDATPLGLVVITIDTLRADYLSCYGNARVVTPAIDRLASGGQLFKQAVSQATTTTPSHASLFTSLYLQDHNVYSNFEALGDKPKTMAEVFYGRGFSTFAIANMRHLNPEVGNLGQGVQTFIRSGNMRRAGASIDEFMSWLDKNGERPFFAWLHFADVHTPYRPPEPYNALYYDQDERNPNETSLARIWEMLPTHMSDHPFFQEWLEGITDLKWVYAQYQGAVTYVDDQIGRLLDTLEKRDLLHRTAIVLTADHGEALGEHGMYFVHTGLYEPTVRVPLITYFPGAGRQGIQVDEVVELVDVLPTVLEYFDFPVPEEARGRSLWPLIRGELTPKRIAFTEHAGRNLVSLRTDRFKYIKHLRTLHIQPSYPFVSGKEELYDLKLDPMEKNNLAATKPETLQVFRNELDARRGQRMTMATGRPQLTKETVDVLRSLGYVQ